MIYEVIEYVPNQMVRLRGENKNIVAIDTLTVESIAGTSRFTYEAAFTFKGLGKLAAPFLRKAFEKLAVDAEIGLRKVL